MALSLSLYLCLCLNKSQSQFQFKIFFLLIPRSYFLTLGESAGANLGFFVSGENIIYHHG